MLRQEDGEFKAALNYSEPSQTKEGNGGREGGKPNHSVVIRIFFFFLHY
jgi:hypothetical protein